jgi:hypothetical protein
MKMILFTLLILTFGFVLYADPIGDGDFRDGYSSGYRHGFQDQQERLNFDYQHSGHEGFRYSDQTSCEFQLGYLQGYVDGFFGKSSRVSELHEEPPYAGSSGRLNFGTVTVFDEPGFDGKSEAFQVGRYADIGDRWNDDIESMQIVGPVRVILFDKKDFEGARTIVESDSPNLASFKKRAASMIVEPTNGGFATVFTGEKFQGSVREFGPGKYPALENDWNDAIESVQLNGRVRLILFDRKNFEGQRRVLETDVSDLDEFSKKAASLIVEPLP